MSWLSRYSPSSKTSLVNLIRSRPITMSQLSIIVVTILMIWLTCIPVLTTNIVLNGSDRAVSNETTIVIVFLAGRYLGYPEL